MNDVDFEKVRSLFESDDKEFLLVFCGEYFKQIIRWMQENCLGRNYQAEMCWFLVVYFKRLRGVYGNKVKWFEFWTINRWIERTICIIVRGYWSKVLYTAYIFIMCIKLKHLKWQKFDLKYLIMLDKKYLLCTCFIEYWLTDNSSTNVLYKDNNDIIFGYIFRSDATGNCLCTVALFPKHWQVPMT
jgi:hypothetical protein